MLNEAEEMDEITREHAGKIPKTIIVCDCAGKHNGLAYWIGARFHTSRAYKGGGVRVFTRQKSLDEGLAAAVKVAAMDWPGYKLTDIRAVAL